MKLTNRQTHTVLAALRYFQRYAFSTHATEHDLATNGGACEQLSPAEIDALCERLNRGDPKPIRGVMRAKFPGPDGVIKGVVQIPKDEALRLLGAVTRLSRTP